MVESGGVLVRQVSVSGVDVYLEVKFCLFCNPFVKVSIRFIIRFIIFALDEYYRIMYYFCNMIQQLINDEKFTNIAQAQAGLTKLFNNAASTSSFYRVLKNDQSLGVLVPEKMWASLIEDLEALSSPNYRAQIAIARADKKRYSLAQIKKELGLK